MEPCTPPLARSDPFSNWFFVPYFFVAHIVGKELTYNVGMDTPLVISQHLWSLQAGLGTIDQGEISKAIIFLRELRGRGGMAWIVGNGGSAATASHFANDLIKMANVRAIALPDLVPVITAYGNDNGWDRMFSAPLSVLWGPGDILIAISCSGRSSNVLTAARATNPDALMVITGNLEDSKLSQLSARVKIHAVSSDIKQQEDMHMAICHAIAGAV
jgi:D-sedoheptulose 7-phosphate isomerase